MEEQHKNRRGLLIGVGIVELLFAAFLLLMLLLMGFSFVMTLFLDQSEQLYPAGSVAYVIIIYGGMCAFFVVMGIGTIRGKTWARKIMLVVSAFWFLTGLMTLLFSLFAMNPLFDMMDTMSGLPIGGIIKAVMTVFLVIFFVLLLALMCRVNVSPDVKRTFDTLDEQKHWTDRMPLPLLAVFMFVVFVGLSLLSSVFMPVPFMFFGAPMSGPQGKGLWLLSAVLLFFFAYLLFKKRKAGWIGSLALYSFFSLTTIVTIISKGLSAYYQDAGMYVPSPAELELIDSMFASLERALPAFMFIYFALFTGLFLWAGKQLWDHEETEV